MSVHQTPSTPDASIVSRDVAARLIMVSVKRIDQLVTEGWIRRVGRNRYQVVDVVQGYIRFQKDGLARKAEQADKNPVTEARIREIEQRLADRAEKRVGIDEHTSLIDELIVMVREEFSKLPDEIDPRLQTNARTAVTDIFDRIDRYVDERRRKLLNPEGREV